MPDINDMARDLADAPVRLIEQILHKHHRALLEELRDEVKAMAAARNEWREKYLELLYAVATNYPGESRHETALRYINERENAPVRCASNEAVTEKDSAEMGDPWVGPAHHERR